MDLIAFVQLKVIVIQGSVPKKIRLKKEVNKRKVMDKLKWKREKIKEGL